MLAVFTAFVSLVFAYFFYWTIHDDFPPAEAKGPGVFCPCHAGALLLGAWAGTMLARRWNRADRTAAFYDGSMSSVGCAFAGGAAILAGPWLAAASSFISGVSMP
jgi:cytochrome c oxidase subunit I+III